MCLITLAVSLPSLKPADCGAASGDPNCTAKATSLQLGVFFGALYVLAIGTGGTKPNISTIGADQFDDFDPKEHAHKLSFFNWWMFSIFFGTLFANTVLVYIQDNVGWTVGYALPTLGLAVSIAIFVAGTRFYRHKRPSGSPFTRMARVLVAAARKWRVALPADPKELHELGLEAVADPGFSSRWIRLCPQPVSISRLVSFLTDWLQPLLISPDHSKKSSGNIDACLDCRCWAILDFCLENSSSCCVSPNLLRAVTRVLKHAVLVITGGDLINGQELSRLVGLVFKCLSLVLSSNARAFYNVGVELWLSCALEVADVVRRISVNDESRSFSSSDEILWRLSSLLLEHFAVYLRFHANPKNVFRAFVERLLEPLLELLVLLHLRAKDGKCGQEGSLLKMVESVLLNGLFHPVHIAGFLSLRSLNARQQAKESKGTFESYHKNFFKKLEKIITEKKAVVLGGLGYLLQLFFSSAKVRKGGTLSSKGNINFGKSSEVSEEAQETSRLLFDVFVLFMQPLLIECRRYTKKEFSESGEHLENNLVEVHCTLKSMDEILACSIQEKIYVRTEDTSEGANYNFLKEVCDTIVVVSEKIYMLWLSTLHMDDTRVNKMLHLIAREIVSVMGHFLEIEYKAIGDDLVKLWLMLLYYLAVYMSRKDSKPSSLLTSEILNLGRKLIHVYSELRQANNPLFALCRALRLFGNANDARAIGSIFVTSSLLSSQTYLKSAAALFGSQEIRLEISNAIQSIPEGQASGCIQQLKEDITASLEWIRVSSLRDDRENSDEVNWQTVRIMHFDTQAELFGRLLSEVYIIMLDSLTVTATNSIFIGNSIKALLKTLRPSISNLINQSGNVDDFIFSVTRRRLSNSKMPGQRATPVSMAWVFVFFFRLYSSCRSVYRQSICFMPPDLSKKAADSMGSLFVVASGMDWTEAPDSMDEGYFSWIVKPSISLPNVIKFCVDDILLSGLSSYAPLVYVLYVMSLQRLSDLNRIIQAFEYLQERDSQPVQLHFPCNADGDESNKMWRRLISISRQEAAELTSFMTGHLQLLDTKGHHASSQCDENGRTQPAYEDVWDLGVCSLDEKSLPIAIWWLLCQNTDLWCAHASKKYLKKFWSFLLLCILTYATVPSNVKEQKSKGHACQKVTMNRVISEYLSDTISHEQTILYKHFTSRFCRVLKTLLSSVLSNAGVNHIYLDSSLDCSEIFRILEDRLEVGGDGRNDVHDHSSRPPADLILPDMHYVVNSESESSSSFNLELKSCESLLNLLCKMPKVHATIKSFSNYAKYILNLEGLVVSNLLNHHGVSYIYNPYQLLGLLLSCRRAMKYLVMASVEEISAVRDYSSFPHVLDGSSSILWLLKSISGIVGLPHVFFGEKYFSQVQSMIFSLMEHTSHIILAISEGHMKATVSFLISEEKLHTEPTVDREPVNHHMLTETDQQYHFSEYLGTWKYVELMAEALVEQIKTSLVSLESSLNDFKAEALTSVLNWNKLSSMICCFQGFLWGLTSTLDSVHVDGVTARPAYLRLLYLCDSKIRNSVAVFENFRNLCLNILIIYDNQVSEMLDSAHNQNAVHNVNLSKLHNLKGSLFRSLLKGDFPQIAFTLKQLFIVSAAILKVKWILSTPRALGSHVDQSHLVSNYTSILLGTAQLLLLEMAKMDGKPDQFCYVWLDGALTFLEVIESVISLTDTDIVQLIDAHVRAIGKCISLQGKAVTLSSHEMGSYTKMLPSQIVPSNNNVLSPDYERYTLNSFKGRLRMSFKRLVRSTSRLHLKTVVQAIERALVGVREGCNAPYEISTGNVDGGSVSSVVAGGIDCLELVLESVSGQKRVLEKNMPSFLCSLFNIVSHLQGPTIFYVGKLLKYKYEVTPDAGSVILMCVGVLTKIVGRRSFHMDPCHISQCLHMPRALFLGFLQLRDSSVAYDSSLFNNNQEGKLSTDLHLPIECRQFSIELYASCCKLLYTTIRHQKSEARQCTALLQESISTLLSCLEIVGAELVLGKGHFTWEVDEAVKCASFLRRIYEEIRQQKDVFRKSSSYFLSSYILMYSGYGPLKAGIKREIDEAIRPGVYSLIDICTEADLQQLHTSLGEGPCRSTLKTLLHDYKLNFQYEGKI